MELSLRVIFDQRTYRDLWLLTLGIPSIALLIQHVGVGWETTRTWIGTPAYFAVLLYNAIGVAAVFGIGKLLILWLDSRLPYRPRIGRRLTIQLFLSFWLTFLIGELHTELYLWWMGADAVWSTRFSTDLPVALLITWVVNMFYVGLYLNREIPTAASFAKNREAARPVDQSLTLPVGKGKRITLLPIEDIILLQASNKITLVLDRKGRRYWLHEPLQRATEKLAAANFFRANRQFIVPRATIAGFQKLPDRKLLIEVKNPDLIPEPILVSKEKATEFVQWLSA